METGSIGDAGLDTGSRLEALIRQAREQAQTANTDQAAGGQAAKVMLGANGGGLAAAGVNQINFDDPLARECFIGRLQDGAQSETLISGHELDPERVAALLDLG
jgi:hypothetical protein